MNSYECLSEKTLPGPEAFYNKLRKTAVDPLEYESLQKLWNNLKFQELRDLATLYLKLDVLLLGE